MIFNNKETRTPWHKSLKPAPHPAQGSTEQLPARHYSRAPEALHTKNLSQALCFIQLAMEMTRHWGLLCSMCTWKPFNFQMGCRGRGQSVPRNWQIPSLGWFSISQWRLNGHIMCLITAIKLLWAATAESPWLPQLKLLQWPGRGISRGVQLCAHGKIRSGAALAVAE